MGWVGWEMSLTTATPAVGGVWTVDKWSAVGGRRWVLGGELVGGDRPANSAKPDGLGRLDDVASGRFGEGECVIFRKGDDYHVGGVISVTIEGRGVGLL
jgi:hypothetical protein